MSSKTKISDDLIPLAMSLLGYLFALRGLVGFIDCEPGSRFRGMEGPPAEFMVFGLIGTGIGVLGALTALWSGFSQSVKPLTVVAMLTNLSVMPVSWIALQIIGEVRGLIFD